MTSMYPPQFNLRHFMSHLAPGGYYLLYVLIFSVLLLWLLLPALIKDCFAALCGADNSLPILGFVVLIVIAYFVGVVLRLPSVDEVDEVSIEYLLRRLLKQKVPLKNRILDGTISVISWFRAYKPFPLPCTSVSTLPGPRSSTSPPAPDMPLRDWIRELAAATLIASTNRNSTNSVGRINASKLKGQSDTEYIMYWLWAADRFPYPLFHTYRTHLRSTKQCQREFDKHLWDIIVETMGGTISSKHHLRHEPFNRCKLTVISRSGPLAAEVAEREALVRMMAGFYQALWLASRGSLLSLLAVAFCWALPFSVVTESPASNWSCAFGWFARSSVHLWGALLLFAISFIFNTAMFRKVVVNFHNLRISESQAVFDSYILAKKLPPIAQSIG